MIIRSAGFEDAEALARLGAQLGYPASVAEITPRLQRVLASPGRLLVAEAPDSAVIGWVHVVRRDLLTSEPFAELTGLVVDVAQHGRGVGRALVGAAAEWARSAGCGALRVRSNVKRDDAAAFYRRLGFTGLKQQNVLTLELGSSGMLSATTGIRGNDAAE